MRRHGSKEELAFNNNGSGEYQRIIQAVDDRQYTLSGEWFLSWRNSEVSCEKSRSRKSEALLRLDHYVWIIRGYLI